MCKSEIACKFFECLIALFEPTRHRTIYRSLSVGYFVHICKMWGRKDRPTYHIIPCRTHAQPRRAKEKRTEFPGAVDVMPSSRAKTIFCFISSQPPSRVASPLHWSWIEFSLKQRPLSLRNQFILSLLY